MSTATTTTLCAPKKRMLSKGQRRQLIEKIVVELNDINENLDLAEDLVKDSDEYCEVIEFTVNFYKHIRKDVRRLMFGYMTS